MFYLACVLELCRIAATLSCPWGRALHYESAAPIRYHWAAADRSKPGAVTAACAQLLDDPVASHAGFSCADSQSVQLLLSIDVSQPQMRNVRDRQPTGSAVIAPAALETCAVNPALSSPAITALRTGPGPALRLASAHRPTSCRCAPPSNPCGRWWLPGTQCALRVRRAPRRRSGCSVGAV